MIFQNLIHALRHFILYKNNRSVILFTHVRQSNFNNEKIIAA